VQFASIFGFLYHCASVYIQNKKTLSRSHYENLSISTLMLLSIYLYVGLSICLFIFLSINLSRHAKASTVWLMVYSQSWPRLIVLPPHSLLQHHGK